MLTPSTNPSETVSRNNERVEEAKLEAIFKASRTGMALMRGPEFIFDRVNPHFKSLVGPREYIGKTWRAVYPELAYSELPELLREVYLSGNSYHSSETELWVAMSDGEITQQFYTFSYDRISLNDGEPYGILCQGTNVTDRVLQQRARERVDEQLGKSIRDFEKERDARERFVTTLTHDLRTPLSTARITAELLARKSPDNSAVQIMTAKIVASIDRAGNMIRDLLDVSLINGGQELPLQRENCRLDDIVQSIATDLAQTSNRQIVVQKDVQPVAGFWDCNGLRRAIENLVGNAIKYGQADSDITVRIFSQPDHAQVEVHNFGNPIPEKDQADVFNPYLRTASAKASTVKGWGIGLTLVKGIVDAHRGSIHVESNCAQGTSFSISIPFGQEPKP